jgi:hypothetical protein
MNKTVLKIGIALLTFLLGVALASLWFVRRASHHHEYSVVLLGKSPSMTAASLPCSAQQEDLEAVRKQLAEGVDVNGTMNECIPMEPFPRGVTLLMKAAGHGSSDIVTLLLDKGADINLRDSGEDDALMYAASSGRINVISILVERGADINTQGDGGQTPLMRASEDGELETVRYLLDQGAKLNAKNSNGTTALMFAAGFKQQEIARLLLAKGADPKLKDSHGRTFTHYERFGYPEEYMIYRR